MVTPGGFNAWASTSDAIGCAYVIEWPSGWCALSDLSSARTVGVDASFKNPADEASTLAVFVSDVPVGQRSVADQGSLDALARSRADSAPRQQNIGKRKRKTPLASGGGDALTYDIETKVGGGTAGRFGAAVELVSIGRRRERVFDTSDRVGVFVAGGEGEAATRGGELRVHGEVLD